MKSWTARRSGVAWRIEYLRSVRKQVEKLDAPSRQRIHDFLEKRLVASPSPRVLGKPLKGDGAHLWRYRVGHFRILCEIRDSVLIVLVVRVADRKDVYR